jgi:hypothetical protein
VKLSGAIVISAWLMFMVLSFGTSPLNAGASEKHISPKCSTQIDPNNDKLILMVCDFSEISVADQVIDAKAYVEITDASGTSLGSQTLHFADYDHKLRGGRKYARRFEYAASSKGSSGLQVKMSSAEAVVAPNISAVSK